MGSHSNSILHRVGERDRQPAPLVPPPGGPRGPQNLLPSSPMRAEASFGLGAIKGLRGMPCVWPVRESKPWGESPGDTAVCRPRGMVTRDAAHPHGGRGVAGNLESGGGGVRGGSLWASVGQAQNWSPWRFCLCNTYTRPFAENNPGSAGQATASRGVAVSFLLFLARLPSCLSGSSVRALGFRAACAFQCLQLPSYRASAVGLLPRGGDSRLCVQRVAPPPPLRVSFLHTPLAERVHFQTSCG